MRLGVNDMNDPTEKNDKSNEETVSNIDSEPSEDLDSVESEQDDENLVDLIEEDSTVSDLQNQLTSANQQVAELTARLRTLSAAYQRQTEEIPAMKERIERQMSYRESKRRGEVVSLLFEPVENLRRSLDLLKKSEVEESHVNGLDLVVKSFMDGFHKLGIQEISPKGEVFDPNFHEALMSMPVNDPVLGDTVIEVYSTGYRVDNIVLKPAKVIVGLYTAPEVQEESPDSETTDDAEETD